MYTSTPAGHSVDRHARLIQQFLYLQTATISSLWFINSTKESKQHFSFSMAISAMGSIKTQMNHRGLGNGHLQDIHRRVQWGFYALSIDRLQRVSDLDPNHFQRRQFFPRAEHDHLKVLVELNYSVLVSYLMESSSIFGGMVW